VVARRRACRHSTSSNLLQRSLGIWFVTWAIRYKADWDYKLNCRAKPVRWGEVGIGYVLAASASKSQSNQRRGIQNQAKSLGD